MDQLDIALVFVFGFACGYALRAAISAARRRKARLRRARAVLAAEAAEQLERADREETFRSAASVAR
jgi:hypothetical protein